jgi:hypothetical protein
MKGRRELQWADKSFVKKFKDRPGFRSKGSKIIKENDDDFQLRDGQTGYGIMGNFNIENSFYWDTDHKPEDPHVP